MNEWIKAQTQPIRQSITMSEWAEEWFATYTQNLAPGSKRNKRTHLVSFCSFHHYGERPLTSFRTIELQRYLNSLAGCTPTYISCVKTTIRSLFSSAFSNQLLEPFDLSGLVTPKGEDGSHRAITEDERTILMQTWKGHEMGKFAMGYLFTGARRNELLALQWEDIDLNQNTISINKTYNKTTKSFEPTKTKTSVRVVPILAPLKTVLESLPKDEPPFDYKKFYDKKWQNYLKFLKQFGVTENITPHDLRDSYATMLYDISVDVKLTQKLLGHKDISTTMNFYVRLSKQREKNELQKIKDYFDTHFDTHS